MFLFIDFRRFCSSLSVQMEKIHDTVRKSTLALRQRRRLLLSKLKLCPDFLRASFVERFCRCGKTNCRCNLEEISQINAQLLRRDESLCDE